MNAIMLVDDEELFRERLQRAFLKRGYTVYGAADYDEAMVIVRQYKPPMAVVDLKMPGKSGLELIEDALGVNPEMRIVVLTGYGSIATATQAIKLGAAYYLPKPADLDDIINAFSKEQESPNKPSVTPEFIPPSLARVEWEHINRVLADCGGNVSVAANKLGIHRRTLQRKLYKFAPNK